MTDDKLKELENALNELDLALIRDNVKYIKSCPGDFDWESFSGKMIKPWLKVLREEFSSEIEERFIAGIQRVISN